MTDTTSPMRPEALTQRADQFRRDVASLRAEIAKVIVGQDETVTNIITCIFCGGHALLEGVPGVGKTLLIRTLAQAMKLGFSRIQFTPDLMPADISGTTIVMESDSANGSRGRQFVFQRGPIFAQIVLADEINRATPKTQSALLEAMAEKSVTVAGVSHAMDRPFFVLATQNPLEQEGTYPLPEAQLDRFMFKLLVGAPTRSELAEVLNRTTTATRGEATPVIDAARVLEHQELVRMIVMADHVQDYAVRLVLATHARSEGSSTMIDKFVRFGASPRAAQAMVLAAKCRAMMDGRAAASVSDIQSVAKPTLRHRLILNFEAQAEGVTTDAVIENLVSTLPVAVNR